MTRSTDHSGFTLVELAIALMIIGLLIGGVLKGIELVENARISQVVRETKAYEAAIISFQSIYGPMPGDIMNPGARIPNCTSATCIASGNLNRRIDTDPERINFFLHLSVAGLVTGINNEATTWITIVPNNAFGGVYRMTYYPDGIYAAPYDPRGGNFWMIFGARDFSRGIDVLQAYHLDIKLDDGLPRTGMFRGFNANVGVCNYAEYNINNNATCAPSFVFHR